MPAEIAVQVFRGYAVEPSHPAFEAAAVIIDVLNVVDAPATLARAEIERYVREAGPVGERAVGMRAVADQHRRFGDNRLQRRRARPLRAVSHDLIRRRLVAVACN